jgi:hypothetical protein
MSLRVIYNATTLVWVLKSGTDFRLYTNSVAPEPEGSSPHSQNPATGPNPEQGESTPHAPPPHSSLSH